MKLSISSTVNLPMLVPH